MPQADSRGSYAPPGPSSAAGGQAAGLSPSGGDPGHLLFCEDSTWRRVLSQDRARSSSTTIWHSVVTGGAAQWQGTQGEGAVQAGVSPRARRIAGTRPDPTKAPTPLIPVLGRVGCTGKPAVICLGRPTPFTSSLGDRAGRGREAHPGACHSSPCLAEGSWLPEATHEALRLARG